MKKYIWWTMGVLLLPLWIYAQGVEFCHLSFSEALNLAEKEKKVVFIDFYTEWCGPCKKMSQEVFPQKEVGDYFNRTFVALKMDAEKGEGKDLAQKYKIQAYPTFMVLNTDGSEIYRISGFRPATEFVEKMKKGIDPEWSPAGLTRRYEKGERTPELVHDYAVFMMEQGKQEVGFRVVNDYFNSLSSKKRVKPENYFLYSQFSFNLEDPKARYLYENKDRFIRANGKERVENLLYRWLRIQLMPFMTLRSVQPISKADFEQVKAEIEKVGMSSLRGMPDLLTLAELHVRGDFRKYLEYCEERFPDLEEQDRTVILLDMDQLKGESPDIKKAAAGLIRNNLAGIEGVTRRVLRMKMLELENRKDFTLRAEIDAVKSGKVVVMGWSPRRMIRDTFAFRDHRIDLDMAGRDTMKVTLKLLCKELGCVTKNLGTYYPNVDIMLVPGEYAAIKIKAEQGKVPRVEWIKGGEIGYDYYRLQYEQAVPAELAYRQLTMDNIIAGGDIRNYKTELDAYMKANKDKIISFVRDNKESFISATNLLEHYNWFDENEIEQIYGQFPEVLRMSPWGRVLQRKLEAGKPYRTGTQAPDFKKKDLNGKMVSLAKLKGSYVLLDFWGSWCGPCRASHPHLKELYQKYGKQMIFISVANENVRDLNESRKLWKEAVQKDGLTWTQILNNEGAEACNLLDLFYITSFPTKILIDPEGKVAARYVGALGDPAEKLQEIFRE